MEELFKHDRLALAWDLSDPLLWQAENSPCALNAIPQACQQAGVTTIINVLFKE